MVENSNLECNSLAKKGKIHSKKAILEKKDIYACSLINGKTTSNWIELNISYVF